MIEKMPNTVYYRRRWYILGVIALVNFSNSMAWLSYAPISSYTAGYFGWASAHTVLNAIFMACAPFSILSMWVNARYGLRLSCFIGAWLNLLGALLRLFASYDTLFVLLFGDEASSTTISSSSKLYLEGSDFSTTLKISDSLAMRRFWITFIGQAFASAAQPFALYLPAAMAAAWFPPDAERVVANTFASLASPLGAATIFALAPHIVNAERPRDFFELNAIVAVWALAGALFSLGVTSSRPPTRRASAPPLLSGVDEETKMFHVDEVTPLRDTSLWHGIRHAASSRSFIVLAIGLGSGVGLFNALCNILQPILCSRGYSNTFAGALGGGMIVVGLIAAALIGAFAGRTRLYEETMKACFCGAAFAACAFLVLARFDASSDAVAAGVAVFVLSFGAFGLAAYPLGLELGVETTFPVSESTSTGLLSLASQLFGAVYIFFTSALRYPIDNEGLAIQTCTENSIPIGVYNWTYSLMAWTICLVTTSVFFAFAFWPTYHRMKYELAQNTGAIDASAHDQIVNRPNETIPLNAPA